MFGANNYLPIFSQQLLTAHQGHHQKEHGDTNSGKMVKAGRNGRQKNWAPVVALKFDSPSVLKLEKESRLWRGGREHNHGRLLLGNIGHVWSGQLHQGTWHKANLQVTFTFPTLSRDVMEEVIKCGAKFFSSVCVCVRLPDLPGKYV